MGPRQSPGGAPGSWRVFCISDTKVGLSRKGESEFQRLKGLFPHHEINDKEEKGLSDLR
jgi:hypothetical protein